MPELTEVEQLRLEVAKWKNNHNQMVQRNAMLRQRPDLPVDRIPAIKAYEAKIDKLKAFVVDICSNSFQGYDATADYVQELGVKHGVLVEEVFDPTKHFFIQEPEEYTEGDSIFVLNL